MTRATLICFVFVFFSMSLANSQNNLPKTLPTKKAKDVPSTVMPQAQTSKDTKPPRKKMTIDTSKVIQLTYLSAKWNKSSTQIDSGSLILRDKTTGQTVQLELQETAPDSNVFSGLYGLSIGGNEGLLPEVYFVEEKVLANKQLRSNLDGLIKSGQATRKPFIMTRDDRGLQSMDVFDTSDQARRALETFQKKSEPEAKEQPVPTAAKAVLEAEKLAEMEREKRRLEAEARARESERIRLEELERKKAEERIAQQKSLDEAERRKRKQQSLAFAELALDYYRVGNFQLAEENFAKSVELDPEYKKNYYKYGVALYRNEKFNQSLVYLRLAEGNDFDPVEKDFYIGLNHYRLKEYVPAIEAFKKVEATNHDPLAPSAAFYQGIVLSADTKYEEAKNCFQRVLDTSKDPKLDERAEQEMEKIDRILFFAKNKAKMFIVSLTIGPQYDSNVLLQSDAAADQGSSSEKGSVRNITGGSLHFRPIYEKEYEFGVKLKGDYTWTASEALKDYDPLTVAATAPFVYKGILFGKGLKAEFIPGYERLYIGTDPATGSPKETLNSMTFDFLNSLVMKDNWFLSLNFKYRGDTFKDSPDSDATKLTFGVTNSIFLNKPKTEAVLIDTGYTTNNSKGDASKYNRIDLGTIYLMPWIWKTQLIGGLSYYNLTYSSGTPAKKDSNITASVSVARPLNDWLKAIWSTSYISNSSNVDSGKYSKFTSGLLFTAEHQF